MTTDDKATESTEEESAPASGDEQKKVRKRIPAAHEAREAKEAEVQRAERETKEAAEKKVKQAEEAKLAAEKAKADAAAAKTATAKTAEAKPSAADKSPAASKSPGSAKAPEASDDADEGDNATTKSGRKVARSATTSERATYRMVDRTAVQKFNEAVEARRRQERNQRLPPREPRTDRSPDDSSGDHLDARVVGRAAIANRAAAGGPGRRRIKEPKPGTTRSGPLPPREAQDRRPAPPPPPPAPPAKAKEPPKPKVTITLLGVSQATKHKAAKPSLTAKEALAAKMKNKGGQKKKDASKPTAAVSETVSLAAELVSATADDAENALLRAGPAADSLVDAWLEANNAAAIGRAAQSDKIPGPVRKAARRALNVLRARGVAIEEAARIAKIADTGEEAWEASFQVPDASGTYSFTISKRQANGRCHVAEVLIREPIGIMRAASGWLSRTQLREGRTRAAESLGFAPVNVPVDWARHRIAEAKKLNEQSKQLMPMGFDACQELLAMASDETPPHPLAELQGQLKSDDASKAIVEGSSALHAYPEFRSWLPDRRALDEFLHKLGEALGPGGAEDREKFDGALTAELRAATDRFFSPEIRKVIVTRMMDAALSVQARLGDDQARDVLAVAKAVDEAGLITSPPQEIPFLLGFFQKGIAMLAQQGGGQLRIPMSGPAPAASEPASDSP